MDLGDPSYHSNPVVPMCAKTHEFLRLIRVLIREMVDTLDMSNDAGFVTIGDLVQMLMAWGSDANEEQVLDLLTKVGSQFLDVLHDDTTILIKDKAHESVPSIATFKSTPSHVSLRPPPMRPWQPLRGQDLQSSSTLYDGSSVLALWQLLPMVLWNSTNSSTH